MLESLSNRLRLARIELGLTQAEAASAIGIKQPMLHRAETSLEISSNRLLQILDYYVNQRQINPAWLLSEPNTDFDIVVGENKVIEQKLKLLQGFRETLDGIDKAAK
ncbi:helix-turn-helix domain-containing protein [Spirosoma endophyticum]|uniref:Helix-turn-helix domain-containing protein n=1 Tax=Spirosoma endophyticum TaxID=662367 RepID=A0A1I1ZL97_9BACT|nr:helix-turn-helix transcriptional regulator [Spirosoma endophyticum]SFE31323.1 Helix-turn-helix domain-containing protein [Spirosoma endophyticum]